MSEDQFDKIKKGRIFRINAPSNDMGEANGDAKYLSPQEQLKEFSELITERYTKLALGKSLSMSQISGESATSGFQLALSMSKIMDANKRERKYYRQPIKKTLKLLCELAKQTGFASFPNNPEFNIDFGEMQFAESPDTKEQTRALRLANKTANLIDFEMEDNPDLDREEALAVVMARIEENKKINPNPYEQPIEGGEDDDSDNTTD